MHTKQKPPNNPLTRSLILVMALATGLAVANNYYAQPLLPLISQDLQISHTLAGLIVTVAQIGYALGLVFLLPLGDLLERRRLIVALSVGTGLFMVLFAVSPGIWILLLAALAVGGLSVLAQILVPFAAGLANERNRGRVVGIVMSGLLIGILLARTASGYLADAGSWRTVYYVAGGAMFLLAIVLWRTLPDYKEQISLDYLQLLHSVLELVQEEPLLRLRSIYGALAFGAFSILWTSIGFLLAGAPYYYNSGTIGLFGLAGAGGALSASAAGRLADRGLVRVNTGIAAVLLTGSWILLWMGQSSLVPLIIGVVLIDIGVQGMHITNQSEIYRLQPDARSRITSAYMTAYFIGGGIGSAASAALYDSMGWLGVAICGGAFGLLALIIWIIKVFIERKNKNHPK